MNKQYSKKKTEKRDIRHPLFSTSFSNWIQLLVDHGGIDKDFFPRAFFITFYSLFTIPARLLSKLLYSRRIEKTSIDYPPIFIVGHWRSGTTYLHEFIGQDPRLSHISLWHTLVPNCFLLLNPLKEFMTRFLPTTRPMDMMSVDVYGPYEEEAGLAVLGRFSFFHCFNFPRDAERQFKQSVLFKGLKDKEIATWKKNYKWFLKAVTLENKGRRLLLKNPANTARISTLLELFPNACFIHIYRNPYVVYFSTKKMRTRVLGPFALQNSSGDEIDKYVFENYAELMKQFFEQKDMIPKGQFVEICYEDLVADPMKQVKKIYSTLNLPDLKSAEPEMQHYLNKQSDYKTNKYNIDKKTIKIIEKHWGFTIKRWGYQPPL